MGIAIDDHREMSLDYYDKVPSKFNGTIEQMHVGYRKQNDLRRIAVVDRAAGSFGEVPYTAQPPAYGRQQLEFVSGFSLSPSH